MRVEINDVYFNVKTLIDPKSQRRGMMGRKFDSSFEGLLFLMGGENQCFWMKNCVIPLDIIMIKNNVIVNIHHFCPPCLESPCPSYCGRGNIVLELEGGTCEEFDIQPGDFVNYVF
jgi:uncharacterized membrane protein (UPF0127 family)